VTSELIHRLVLSTERWISTQRGAYRRRAVSLSNRERSSLAPFFSADTLRRARFAEAKQIPTPESLQLLAQRGAPPPIDFSGMHAFTFGDTVVLADWVGPLRGGLVVRELVHVVQYDVLGLTELARHYVQGWIESGLRYDAIPLEVHAREIQQRFEDPGQPAFSVEAEVRRRLAN
jgi:hypothetical protein